MVYAFCVAIFLIASLAELGPITADEGATKQEPPRLQSFFVDDFSKDSRQEYQIDGEVIWESSKLTLRERANITRRLTAGAWLKIDMNFASSSRVARDTNKELRVWLVLDGPAPCYVGIKESDGDTRKQTIKIVNTGEQNGQKIETVLKEVELAEAFSSLSIEYRFGLVTVSTDDKPKLTACILTNGMSSVLQCRIRAQQGISSLSALSVHRSLPFKQLSAQERQMFASANAGTQQLLRLEQQGDLVNAAKVGEEVLVILKPILGEYNLDYAQRIDNLANVYLSMREYTRAEQLYMQAVHIYKQVLGEQHPHYANGLSSLAGLYYRTGDYLRAEPLQKELVRIGKDVLGNEHPNYVQRLHQLAMLYFAMKDRARAEPLYTEAMHIWRESLTDNPPLYAEKLHDQAVLYQRIEDYERAEQLNIEAIQIRRQVLGDRHLHYAWSLQNLASLYTNTGAYARAQPLYEESIGIIKEVRGEQHLEYATALHNQARLYLEMQDYNRAELLYKETLQVTKNVLGEKSYEYGQRLLELGMLYNKTANYVQAEALLVDTVRNRALALGKKHPDYAHSLNNLASTYDLMGAHAQAEPLYKEAVHILREVQGDKHHEYAKSLTNLARYYTKIADFARAELLYKESMRITGEVLGKKHRDYAIELSSLGHLYCATGDYASALSLLSQAKQIFQIRDDNLGKKDEQFAVTLTMLSEVHYLMRDFSRAQQLLVEALDVFKAVLGDQHPMYAQCANKLGSLYISTGDYAKARPLCAQAKQIFKDVLGEQHPVLGGVLSNEAEILQSMGDYAAAEILSIQAVQITKELFGEKHPDYAGKLHKLAELYAHSKRLELSLPLYEQSLAITRAHLETTAYILSERQQLAMSQSLRYQLDNYLSACLQSKSDPSRAVEHIALWKGSVLCRLRGLRMAADDPAISDKFVALQRATARLSQLVQAIPNQDQAEHWKQQVAQLTAEKESFEVQLIRDSALFRKAVEQVKLEHIRQSLPEDTVLVDYLEFGQKNDRRLLVSIIKRDAAPVMLSLGASNDVGQAIDVWRESFGTSIQGKAAGAKLRQLLWEPILTHFDKAQTILVSTDGVLGRLPLPALPGKKPNSYLIEDHRIALIPVSQLLPVLLSQNRVKPSTHELMMMGDIDYDVAFGSDSLPKAEATARKRPWERSDVTAPVRGESRWPALPATRDEVEFIGGLYNRLFHPSPPSVIDLRKARATESAFRKLAPNSALLHLATHGFFAASDKPSALGSELVAQRGKQRVGLTGDHRTIVQGYSPGQLSGIVFAGANRPLSAGVENQNQIEQVDDGILTADDIAFLPLGGVRLVVLSACETGLGEVAGGEGLLGIQRGFQVAGVRSTVASLWKVNDAATRRLMQEFYTNYLEKEMSILDALREAQLWALNHPEDVPRAAPVSLPDAKVLDAPQDSERSGRLSPQYWAPFVLSGDWR